jgi:alpha-beta hydrolase superfamily lysophospholipase
MGNTCSSVHIALTSTTPDAIEGIVRAYTTLGFERAKTASPEGAKHVILLAKKATRFCPCLTAITPRWIPEN